jgi:tetratricopeptide (TPR) repeat protein
MNAQSPTVSVSEIAREAILHHQAGRLGEAAALYQQILEVAPGRADIRHNLGVLSILAGKPDAALPLFKAALEAASAQEQYWLSYANALLETGQAGQAKDTLKSAMRRGFNSPAMQTLRQKATAALNSPADGQAPSTAETAQLAALFRAGDYAEMERRANALVERYPASGSAWKALGAALMMQKKDALSALQKTVELLPGDAETHNNLSNALKGLRRLDEAAASCRRALEIDPDLAKAHSTLGDILRDLGQFDDAVASYRRALAIKPDHAEAHNSMGNAMRNLEKTDAAEASYRQALAFKPDFAEAHNNLGIVLKGQGKLYEAVACFERALSIEPELVSAHINMSQILFDTGSFDGAQRHRDLAYGRQCLFVNPPLPSAVRTVLVLLDAVTGNVPSKYLFPVRDNNRIEWIIEYATEEQYQNLPPHDVVFNAIGEPDVTGAVEPLARFMQTCDRPLLNSPIAVARTARHMMPELFGGVEGILIPAMWRIEQKGNWSENPDFQFPVLVRPLASHGGQGMNLVENRTALVNMAQDGAGEVYLSNYHDYRSADGYFRKYRIIFVDRRPYPYHLAISEQWMVHYQTANMRLPRKLEEERRFLECPAGVLGATGMAAIEAIGKRLDLDYAGVDFSVMPDGRLLIFEANATMLAHPEQDDLLAFKNPYIQKIYDAFDDLLARKSGKGRAGQAMDRAAT